MTAYAKVLIAVPSPRDLPAFAEAVDKIPADKLFVKYMREQDAYQALQAYFLEQKQYTHLAILPDDLIVEPFHWYRLIADLQECDFPVLCGVCNLDVSPEHKGMLNVCVRHLPSRNASERTYEWLMEGGQEHTEIIRNKKPPIIKVMFAGFPFFFMRRDIVEQIEFRDDRRPVNPMKLIGCCIDVMTCVDLHDLDIPIYCDLRVRMHHMKIDDSRVEGRMVGVKQPQVYFSSFK